MTEMVWAEELPPFDSNPACCPKCGNRSMSVIFHHMHTNGFPCKALVWVLDGHLCRVCGRCTYGWCEAPLDIKPAGDGNG